MFQKIYDIEPPVLGFITSGKLSDFDYQTQFMPEVEDAIEKYGKINMMWKMEQFDGWDLHAIWDEIKMSLKTKDAIGRIALIGDKEWQGKLPRLLQPFTHAEVRYFSLEQEEEAKDWLKQTH